MFTDLINALSYIAHHYLIVLAIGALCFYVTRPVFFNAYEGEVTSAEVVSVGLSVAFWIATFVLVAFGVCLTDEVVRKVLLAGVIIALMGHYSAMMDSLTSLNRNK